MNDNDFTKAKYYYNVLCTFYKNMIDNKDGFSKNSIINFLNDLTEYDLDLAKWYIGEKNYELYYDYHCGVEQDYDALEQMYKDLINIINEVIDSRNISKKE